MTAKKAVLLAAVALPLALLTACGSSAPAPTKTAQPSLVQQADKSTPESSSGSSNKTNTASDPASSNNGAEQQSQAQQNVNALQNALSQLH